MNFCTRDLNVEFVDAGYLPIQHTFDVWHMVKVNLFFCNTGIRFVTTIIGNWLTCLWLCSSVLARTSSWPASWSPAKSLLPGIPPWRICSGGLSETVEVRIWIRILPTYAYYTSDNTLLGGLCCFLFLWFFHFFPEDAVTLREMILSIPLHLQNIHIFPENTQYKVATRKLWVLTYLFIFRLSLTKN